MQQLEKKKYCYFAFGLVFSSELELTEFLPCEGTADVNIILDEVPTNIENPIEVFDEYQLSETEFLLFKKVANYHVKYGNTITIQIHEYDINRIKAYLMAIIMGVLLIQRGLIPIHGSSIVINGKAIVFTGRSGAGKSTLCAALRNKSYEYMSDDITAISINSDGVPVVIPAYPQQRLSRHAAKMLGYESDVQYNKESVPLFAIFEICKENVRCVEIIKASGTDKLKGIMSNMYYSVIRKRMGIPPEFFIKLTHLANSVHYYYLLRPFWKRSTEEQIRLVMETIR
jgi:alpha-D-ribose 1-methylphosphonate 5-triphosphate synthase subunit PhnL